MSVAFVPERLRGKVEVNQQTLQWVSAGRGGRGGGSMYQRKGRATECQILIRLQKWLLKCG
uniref:Uncharacterized protein n=1 Tax=Amazona collaria TaxID=241587 RepID=A0A8B9J0D2_9PSIT